MVEFAKVTFDLEQKRGADVELSLSVRAEWLRQSGTLEVTLPKKLACAHCHSGGCDACGRSGAVIMAETTVRVELSPRTEEGPILLRLPGYGGADESGEGTRGHLLLTLRPSEHASAEVHFTRAVLSREAERVLLMKRSLFVAAFLIVTFFGLLRLSGWM